MTNESLSTGDHSWELVPVSGDLDPLAIPDDRAVVVGRQTECDLAIMDPYVSRQHASLEVRDGGLYLKDLDSTQGTFVNDDRVSETRVQHGDEIRVEKYRFTVRQLDYNEDSGSDDAGATIIRKIPDPSEAGTVVLKTPASEPQETPAAKTPAVESAPEPPAPPTDAPQQQAAPPAPPEAARPEVQVPAAKPPAASAEAAQPPAEKPERGSPPEQPAGVQGGAGAGKGDWWVPQDKGVKGTELFKAVNLDGDETSRKRVDVVADGPMLLGISGSCEGQEFTLQQGKFIIGRGDATDIHIADSTVSDMHAQIIGDEGSWQVVNLMAANGTFVNGRKIQTAFLSPGDIIRMGGVELQFVDNTAPVRGGEGAGGGGVIKWLILTVLAVSAAAGVAALKYAGMI